MSAAEDTEIFAFGDIHGRSDLLAALIDEAAREPSVRDKRAIVFLGDLIDRGYDSLGVVDLAIASKARLGADEAIGLMGNHEAMMRLALDPETPSKGAIDAFETWIANGGDRTLAEFVEAGLAARGSRGLIEAARASLAAARARLARIPAGKLALGRPLVRPRWSQPEIELEAFLALPWNIPLVELDEDRHWAWVRWPFLAHSPGKGGFSGFFVVHGHTPNDGRRDPSHVDQIAQFRLNLDAGSGMTGVAKMAVIRGRHAEVIAARGPTNRELI